jgi:hypothetical protein
MFLRTTKEANRWDCRLFRLLIDILANPCHAMTVLDGLPTIWRSGDAQIKKGSITRAIEPPSNVMDRAVVTRLGPGGFRCRFGGGRLGFFRFRLLEPGDEHIVPPRFVDFRAWIYAEHGDIVLGQRWVDESGLEFRSCNGFLRGKSADDPRIRIGAM